MEKGSALWKFLLGAIFIILGYFALKAPSASESPMSMWFFLLILAGIILVMLSIKVWFGDLTLGIILILLSIVTYFILKNSWAIKGFDLNVFIIAFVIFLIGIYELLRHFYTTKH